MWQGGSPVGHRISDLTVHDLHERGVNRWNGGGVASGMAPLGWGARDTLSVRPLGLGFTVGQLQKILAKLP